MWMEKRRRRRARGVAWVAKDWAARRRSAAATPTYDDERIIKFADHTIYFVNGGGGGPYYGVESLPLARPRMDHEEMEFYLVSETELKVRFGYKKPATIIYKRTHWHAVEDEDCDDDSHLYWIILVMTVVLVCCGCGLGCCAFRACRRKAPAVGAHHRRPARRPAEEGVVASPKGAKGRGDGGVAQGRPRRRHRRPRARTSPLSSSTIPFPV